MEGDKQIVENKDDEPGRSIYTTANVAETNDLSFIMATNTFQAAFAPLLNLLHDDPPYIPLPDPVVLSTFLDAMLNDSLPPPPPAILDPSYLSTSSQDLTLPPSPPPPGILSPPSPTAHTVLILDPDG